MINVMKKDIKIQNKYPIDIIKDNNVCVFFIPAKCYVNGGIMSIFSLCKYSREFCNDYNFVISTLPGKETYAKNNLFPNEENIYRWEQIFSNLSKDKNIIFHIPENYINKFYNSLTNEEVEYLSLLNLQINILNQNIDLMPDKPVIRRLLKITDNITQTTAHYKYTSQEMCDKYAIPLHNFSTYLDINPYLKYVTNDKEKVIIYSPDTNLYRGKISEKIRRMLPEYQIITPTNLPFEEYLKTVANASFVISLGEGFDGYYNIPPRLNTLSFSVYNERFFPDEKWKNMETCYESYDDMLANIVDDIKKYSSDTNLYNQLVKKHDAKRDEIYGLDKYKKNIIDFYNKNYTYKPQTTLGNKDLVSVIVTTYNHADYIEEALDSIYSQKDAPDFEVIIGNDCSTDNTKEVLEKCKEKYPDITIINRDKNLGAQYNLKDLLSRIKGDFFTILEGDDYWKEDYLNRQYNALLNESHAVMSFTDFILLKDGKFKTLKHDKFQPFMGAEYALLYCRPSNFSCCMYRKDALNYIPESFYENPKNFCAFFNFYVLNSGGACYVDEILMVYRQHATSVWSSMGDKKQTLQAINSLYRLSLEIPNKYDSIVLQLINELTDRFTTSYDKKLEKRLFKFTFPYAKKKKFRLTLTKIRKR